MKNKKVLYLTQAAAIAAIYVVLTFVANTFGLANHAIQVRFSEALTILPYFTPVAIPGLFVGCIISNILTGCMPLDVVFGSLATLLGALGTYSIRHLSNRFLTTKRGVLKWLAPIPPIIANTIIVPQVLAYVYKFEGSILYFMLTVGIGELISCGFLGMLLLLSLQRYESKLFT